MRRLQFLINVIRTTTDNKDTNGILDWEMVEWFNDGIRAIQQTIHEMSFVPDMFIGGPTVYDFTGAESYELPSNIYSTNAIELVEVRFGDAWVNDGYTPVKRISDVERPNFFGYFTRDNRIVFSLAEANIAYQNFRITYFRKLPRFDLRWAQITSVTPGSPNTLNFAPGTVNEQFVNIDDIISIVDANGAVVQSGLQIVSVAGLPNSITFTGATTGIASGQYMVMGADSTTACELPDSVEPYLLDYVRQRVYTRQNYNDSNKQLGLTSETKAAVQSLFARKHKDAPDPPITDVNFLNGMY